jgi:ribosome-associated protein
LNKDVQHIVETIAHMADEKKAERIVSIDLGDSSWITDAIILLSVKNSIHAKALLFDLSKELGGVIRDLKSDDFYDDPVVEGDVKSGWVILDLNSILIHCLTDEMRDFYELDSFFAERGVITHY